MKLRDLLEGDADQVGLGARIGVEVGRRVSGVDYILAQQLRSIVRDDFRCAFEKVDIIIAPTTSHTAMTPSDDLLQRPFPRRPVSLVGCPAVSIPCGLSREGLPIGLGSLEATRGRRPLMLRCYFGGSSSVRAEATGPEGADESRTQDARCERPLPMAIDQRFSKLVGGLHSAARAVRAEGLVAAVSFAPSDPTSTV